MKAGDVVWYVMEKGDQPLLFKVLLLEDVGSSKDGAWVKTTMGYMEYWRFYRLEAEARAELADRLTREVAAAREALTRAEMRQKLGFLVVDTRGRYTTQIEGEP